MRYRVDGEGMVDASLGSMNVVNATVGLTLLIGVLFLVVGVRGRQRWLQFWGGLTVLCCAVYYGRGWLELPGLL